jgi:succinyl-diaminopimelate desuccinylase
MVDEVWDDGTDDFPPTTFQISNIQSGTGALNVIPGFKKVHFNFRYSPAVTDIELKQRVEAILQRHDLKYTLEWSETSYPYETTGGELIEEAMASVEDVMGYKARPCTSGGTSDGRFVAATYPNAQICELGLINKTIHKVDERVKVDDLLNLTRIYTRLLERLQEAELTKRSNYVDRVPIEVLP